MHTLTLKENAMLITLHISQWQATKADNKITDEVQKQHNAKNAGTFNKFLVDKKATAAIRSALTKVRDYHYSNTLPWDDSGRRLLKVTHYLEYSNRINELTVEFDQAVEEFIKDYDTYVLDAKVRLGTMFKQDDYPSKDELRLKFKIKTSAGEITSDEDLRVKVNTEQLEQLKENIRIELADNIGVANENIWERIKETVGHLHEKLSDPDATFKNASLDNITELIELIPKLNFTGDQKIEQICEEMKKLVVEPADLRKNTELRENIADKAANILSKYGL